MPSDTFRFVPAGHLPMPGNCAICGSDIRGCIDFGINIDYFGALLICMDCIIEITNVEELDLVRRSYIDSLIKANKEMAAREQRLNKAREGLHNAVVAIVTDFNNSIDSVVRSDVDLSSVSSYDSEFFRTV